MDYMKNTEKLKTFGTLALACVHGRIVFVLDGLAVANYDFGEPVWVYADFSEAVDGSVRVLCATQLRAYRT